MKAGEPGEEDIFAEVVQLPHEQRANYLDRNCAHDPQLRARIEALLSALDRASPLLREPPAFPKTVDLRLPPTEKPGDRIGRYKLLEQIGEGGCGVVYVAEQEEPLRRRVALKVIKLGMDTKQVIARFDAERQALAMMNHPNIAKALDAGATETGRPFFVMELVRGVKITDYCTQHQPALRERLDLFIQVCRAIQHAHQKGIIHRDIKPSNILVTLHDGVPVPKVIDFGIAKATQGRLTDQTVYTAFEQFIGTPAYMSPEQAEMSGLDIDTRSDIYSLGVLLYELLTGTTPFNAKELLSKGLDEMRRTIREAEPIKPSTRLTQDLVAADVRRLKSNTEIRAPKTDEKVRADSRRLLQEVRGDLDWIVMKCLEKDRTRRYETANGLATDVQRHLRNEPIAARPPSKLYEFQQAVRRHKFGFAAATCVMITLLIGVLVNTLQYHRERAARQRAVAAERRQADLRMAAERSREEAELEAYASDMAFASAAMAWGKSLGGVDALLSRWKDHSPDFRGWEWYYMNGVCHRERITIVAGAWVTYTVDWHPDGTRLASGGSEGIIRIWNGRTGRQLLEFPGHAGEINQIAWSPDGKRLATGTDEKAVQIWDPESGAEITRFPGHTNRVYSVVWSPDGQELLSAGDDAVIRLWNVNSGALLQTWTASGSLESLAWNHDGSRFASCGPNEWVQIWNPHEIATAGGRYQAVLKIRTTGKNHQLAWSPDDQRLAVISKQDELLVFDSNAGVLTTNFSTNIFGISFLAWSPNGKYLATGNAGDGSVRVFESMTGTLVDSFGGHRGTVHSLAWTPDSRELVSAAGDGTLKVWEAGLPRSLNAIVQRPHQTYSFEWHPGGRHLLQGNTDGSLWIWDTTTWADPIHLEASTSWVFRVAWNPSGTQFASGTMDGLIRIWNWPECKLISSLHGDGSEVRALAWSRDGRQLASICSGMDGGFNIWDANTWTHLHSQAALHGLALAWNPNSQHLAVAGRSVLAMVDARTGSEVLRLGSHGDIIREIAWSPDGRQVATASDDNSVKIWDVATAREVRMLVGFSQKVYSVDWSPDGTRLATADWAGQVNIWNPVTGRLLCTLASDGAQLFCVRWNPDGKRLAASSIRGEILQFDARAGYEIERKRSALR